jgi:hypothetical protein
VGVKGYQVSGGQGLPGEVSGGTSVLMLSQKWSTSSCFMLLLFVPNINMLAWRLCQPPTRTTITNSSRGSRGIVCSEIHGLHAIQLHSQPEMLGCSSCTSKLHAEHPNIIVRLAVHLDGMQTV